ncbi:MAG: sterol desaturase family protein [Flavobacteriales bacterium]|nr:sterol desaturase family protein [Flavobacteriales bacterium]MCB9168248.1 sterol desaturase family protein [Flavobacteriales bacterium]
MTFDLIGAWLEMKHQLPEIPIEGIGLRYLYPVFVILIVIEYLKARELYDLKESLSGFVMGAGATIVKVVTGVFEVSVYLFLFHWAEPFRQAHFGYSSLGWAWYVWVIAVLADDHNFYWHHRIAHNVRLLWAAHLPHHSGRQFNLTVSIRNGWFINLFKPVYWLWMPLLGFEPIMIVTCMVANSFYQFFLHSQLVPSLGWFERIFNTPYVHVVHHSSNTEYLDRNHGGILTIWDQLYGTWQEPIRGVKAKYGISHDPDSYDPVKHNLFEFQEIWRDVKRAPTWRAKLMYIFGPPGWSHDGSTKTSRQLQRELREERAKRPTKYEHPPEAVRA